MPQTPLGEWAGKLTNLLSPFDPIHWCWVPTSVSGTEAIRVVLPSAVNVASGLGYDLLVTDRRVIGACVGDLRWGYGLAYNGTLRLHQQQRQRYAGLTLNQIVSAGPDNFEISLDKVERVLLEPRDSRFSLPVVSFWMEGQEIRFWLLSSTRHPVDSFVRNAQEVLPLVLPGKVFLTP